MSPRFRDTNKGGPRFYFDIEPPGATSPRLLHFLRLLLTDVLDRAVGGAPALAFAGILAGAGVLFLSLLHVGLILLRAVGGATTRTFAGILAGARMFRRRLGGAALYVSGVWIEGVCVQTAYCAAEQAGEGSCQDQGIRSTLHIFKFSLS